MLTGAANVTAQKNVTDSFVVAGNCSECKDRIEKAAKIPGVSMVNWDIPTHTLTVSYNPQKTTIEKIQCKIADAGHDTPLELADDEVYASLPDCCLYREVPEKDASKINGVILSEDKKGYMRPLEGASVIWLKSGKGTTSDKHGVFAIEPSDSVDKLIISYAGFTADTLQITSHDVVQVILGSNNILKAVQVTAKNRNTYINKFSAARIQNISSGELLKAACCNLSESFETNPSVDVATNDAATGSKQIQLLGLAGVYTQLMVENIPGPRGLFISQGLNSIAGPWVEGIQIIKGAGSVVNGYESIAGQINVELRKPHNSDKLFANVYSNNIGKTDLNLNIAKKLSDRWSVGLLLHDAFLNKKTDYNKDGFIDQPTGNLFSAVNRWWYQAPSGFEFQAGVKILSDRKQGGMADLKSSVTPYQLEINTDRYEGFSKIGYVFNGSKYKSIGLIISGYNHEQNSFFGNTIYNARQNNIYTNLIYQNIIGNSNHKFRTGLSFNADNYKELYITSVYKRQENVAGAFYEYTYSKTPKFAAVAGLRADHNNIYGWFATPRLHLKYMPFSKTTLRFSTGRGQRTANIFAENMAALVSSRVLNIHPANVKYAYGLKPEVAWNNGLSIDQQLKLFGRTAYLSFDFYRNDFTDQVIADIETAGRIDFYNLKGKSFSNSFQTELNFFPVKDLDLRLAYRWYEVRTDFNGQLRQKPFTAKHRAFANIGYGIKGWKFDYTVNYVGEKRIPSTVTNPVKYQMAQKSPGYFTMNAQVSKTLIEKYGFDFYIGMENITGYMQKHAIIAADDPFSQYFDASMIWGPLTERMVYAGLRFKL